MTETSSDRPVLNAEFLYRKLNEKFSAQPDAQLRVVAHICAKHGHDTVASFHQNGSTDAEKVQTYSECLTAILKRDYSRLLGQSPPITRDTLADEATRIPAQPPVEPPAEPPAPSLEAPAPPLDLASIIAAAVAPHVKARTEVSSELILGLVRQHTLAELAALSEKIDACIAQVPARQVLEVRQGETVREVHGVTHWQLPQIITWVAADVPVWLWGAAGGGKTHLGRQIADALGLAPHILSIDPTTTVGKLIGYRNLATGAFVEGLLYGPFKAGGLVLLDEIDTGDPGILAALNALLANHHYLFPNGETVERAPSFRVIAGANTKGCGAVAGYTARNRLDAATLDRFAVIELIYDEGLEAALALGQPKEGGLTWAKSESATDDTCRRWVTYVSTVRKAVGTSVLVSPRASILGTRALRAGIGAEEVAEALVFKLVTTDTRRAILNQCGTFRKE